MEKVYCDVSGDECPYPYCIQECRWMMEMMVEEEQQK